MEKIVLGNTSDHTEAWIADLLRYAYATDLLSLLSGSADLDVIFEMLTVRRECDFYGEPWGITSQLPPYYHSEGLPATLDQDSLRRLASMEFNLPQHEQPLRDLGTLRNWWMKNCRALELQCLDNQMLKVIDTWVCLEHIDQALRLADSPNGWVRNQLKLLRLVIKVHSDCEPNL